MRRAARITSDMSPEEVQALKRSLDGKYPDEVRATTVRLPCGQCCRRENFYMDIERAFRRPVES